MQIHPTDALLFWGHKRKGVTNRYEQYSRCRFSCGGFSYMQIYANSITEIVDFVPFMWYNDDIEFDNAFYFIFGVVDRAELQENG